ncbi:hypothetical protein TNCV_865001 [Trichonephila clavipes]|nr:hypothetical protein TNCV_865001 [Trichonephila clavipes]
MSEEEIISCGIRGAEDNKTIDVADIDYTICFVDYFLWGYAKSLVYADKPQTLDHLEDNIRRVIADIRPQMLEKVIENWTSRLDYIRASRGRHMPEIVFKIAGLSNGRLGRPPGSCIRSRISRTSPDFLVINFDPPVPRGHVDLLRPGQNELKRALCRSREINKNNKSFVARSPYFGMKKLGERDSGSGVIFF